MTLELLEKECAIEAPGKMDSRPVFTPLADVFETENNLVVLADLPGADENTIDITVEKNVLSILAKVPHDVPHGHSLSYSEYGSGSYERKFTLPNEIDRDRITASMKNGVLKLVLPKSANSRMKRIAVHAE